MTTKTWISTPPTNCQLCKAPIKTIFVDGATTFGPWANMCPSCHKTFGRGFGIGYGQQYTLTDNKWLKTK